MRRPSGLLFLMVVALAAAAVIAIPSVQEPVLRAAGWTLIFKEPMARADIIVVLGTSRAVVLEAADLVQSGIGTRVAVLPTLRVEKTMSSSGGDSLMRMKAQRKLAI
jgi:hypothetical protein